VSILLIANTAGGCIIALLGIFTFFIEWFFSAVFNFITLHLVYRISARAAVSQINYDLVINSRCDDKIRQAEVDMYEDI
jgi:hypothetical protein